MGVADPAVRVGEVDRRVARMVVDVSRGMVVGGVRVVAVIGPLVGMGGVVVLVPVVVVAAWSSASSLAPRARPPAARPMAAGPP